MKTVLIIIDGLSDDPISELNYKTPLEVSYCPHIHYIATRGRTGLINTCFDGYPIESMICIMGLLGYDPHKYYPNGRASFEAMAKGIPLNDDDLILRCNLITISPKTKEITDFTGGMVTDSMAREIISKIKLPCSSWELYPGQSYRNILIIRHAGIDVKKVKCFEPHMNIGKKVQDILPRSSDMEIDDLINKIDEFLLDSFNQIANMELSNDNKANMLWVWSPSSKPNWTSFKSLTGLKAACVGGLDFLHGLAMAAGIHFDIIPGATGYIDTNYSAKAEYTIKYLKDFDFILTHINAADEEAHQHNFLGKQKVIEIIDELIIGPVLRHLHKHYKEDFRIVVCGDHKTRCSDGKHIGDPVPYAVYGKYMEPDNVKYFSEKEISSKKSVFFSLSFLKEVALR